MTDVLVAGRPRGRRRGRPARAAAGRLADGARSSHASVRRRPLTPAGAPSTRVPARTNPETTPIESRKIQRNPLRRGQSR